MGLGEWGGESQEHSETLFYLISYHINCYCPTIIYKNKMKNTQDLVDTKHWKNKQKTGSHSIVSIILIISLNYI